MELQAPAPPGLQPLADGSPRRIEPRVRQGLMRVDRSGRSRLAPRPCPGPHPDLHPRFCKPGFRSPTSLSHRKLEGGCAVREQHKFSSKTCSGKMQGRWFLSRITRHPEPRGWDQSVPTVLQKGFPCLTSPGGVSASLSCCPGVEMESGAPSKNPRKTPAAHTGRTGLPGAGFPGDCARCRALHGTEQRGSPGPRATAMP